MISNMSKFEATMKACQKSKLVEQKRRKVNKITKESIQARGKKIAKKLEEYDPELDDKVDPVDPVEEPEDTAVIVTDPDLDPEDDIVDDLQDIIDNTPEGEEPTTDEYIGDKVYTCPVCGQNFFSDADMQEGDECPVCGEVPDAFILVGDVEDPDSVSDDDIVDDEDVDTELDDESDDEEELEMSDDIVEEDETKNESKRTKKNDIFFNEATFNPFLTKFIKENYKNAKSMKLVGCKLNKGTLTLECKIEFKSGKTSNTVLTVENFKIAPKMTLSAKLDSKFKSESSKKRTPFIIECNLNRNVITMSKLDYSFITKKEGKRVEVFGKYALKENRSRKTSK